MSARPALEELAALMRKAGITVDPTEPASRPHSAFDEYGLDSPGLLGIVGEPENRRGRALPTHADRCRTPGEFPDLVNHSLMTGA
ncbi:acyl carrier protein [Streptomyces virginiae]|uniref:hypothetical protein n=1 Tax=Streptomyces virginiae TaxID=1961 RepID=UPI0005258E76|nr:hypothetical protein [Streptomyces virginiae]